MLKVSTAAKTFTAGQGHSALCVERVSPPLEKHYKTFSISKAQVEEFPPFKTENLILQSPVGTIEFMPIFLNYVK